MKWCVMMWPTLKKPSTTKCLYHVLVLQSLENRSRWLSWALCALSCQKSLIIRRDTWSRTSIVELLSRLWACKAEWGYSHPIEAQIKDRTINQTLSTMNVWSRLHLMLSHKSAFRSFVDRTSINHIITRWNQGRCEYWVLRLQGVQGVLCA